MMQPRQKEKKTIKVLARKEKFARLRARRKMLARKSRKRSDPNPTRENKAGCWEAFMCQFSGKKIKK
jgi:hypothetical protein